MKLYIDSIIKMWYNIVQRGDNMVSEAQKKATSKYISKAYDQVSLRMPKGKREVYKAYAERKGKSLNALIIELIEKDMQEEE